MLFCVCPVSVPAACSRVTINITVVPFDHLFLVVLTLFAVYICHSVWPLTGSV